MVCAHSRAGSTGNALRWKKASFRSLSSLSYAGVSTSCSESAPIGRLKKAVLDMPSILSSTSFPSSTSYPSSVTFLVLSSSSSSSEVGLPIRVRELPVQENILGGRGVRGQTSRTRRAHSDSSLSLKWRKNGGRFMIFFLWDHFKNEDGELPYGITSKEGCQFNLQWTLKTGVRKQVVNIPSFVVRLDSQKHIDFSLRSPYGGGRPGRVKRKNAKKGQGGAGGGDDEEED
ncbi:hypothetical protein KOW79_000135 [Hemibagrus wyckioides]|uniref:Uncharacterized protein n=1 Tax=Hemibagrus wyckioides TaxID=337641 RepID=A0A9D3P6H4_9TELE|nr:hypothetical protein KOW79_000135 [Hemibagrus wyckioides]